MFRREGEAWVEEAPIPPPDPDRPGGFGTALALHDDVLVVGAPTEDKQSVDPDSDLRSLVGAAYVYRRQDEAWVLEARLDPPAPQRQHFFGLSTAVHGTHLTVGAPHDTVMDADAEKFLAGAIYVYAREQASWELTARLTAPEPAPGAFFGEALARLWRGFGEALALGSGCLVVSQQPLAGATTFPVTTEADQALFFIR